MDTLEFCGFNSLDFWISIGNKEKEMLLSILIEDAEELEGVIAINDSSVVGHSCNLISKSFGKGQMSWSSVALLKYNELLKEEDEERINPSELLYTIVGLPTQWSSSFLAKKYIKTFEKIGLTQDELNFIQDLKSVLNPFLEVTELLKVDVHCTFPLIIPLLIELKNRFYSDNINASEINFNDEESAFDKDNKRIQINEPVNCTGLINEIRHNLSAAMDHYWKDLLNPKLILFILLDP
ncbi:hypothetical protein C1645_835123 [Glomus cerebriforme]|uniref:Uncharacterized protein n=1 Tax=Glomus cerebriforme TaxID=658196 RepID=A0A397SJA5_9GLOM|nr:hypothetical protein C1645_835123 [Glomus cerebriforme]